jgi:hypothetical protein
MVFSMLLLGSGLLTATTFGFGIAWMRARERAIRAEQRLVQTPGGGDARVDRLEYALEAMASEVEHLSEGQRFVSTLLGERAPQERAAGAPSARVATTS